MNSRLKDPTTTERKLFDELSPEKRKSLLEEEFTHSASQGTEGESAAHGEAEGRKVYDAGASEPIAREAVHPNPLSTLESKIVAGAHDFEGIVKVHPYL